MADHYHSGSGEGRSKEGARAAAVRSWADFTNFEYGTVWARFGGCGEPVGALHQGSAGLERRTSKRAPAAAERPPFPGPFESALSCARRA